MTADQRNALDAFLATLSPVQAAAFLDMVSGHVENIETTEMEGEVDSFDFLSAVRDAAVAHIAAPAPAAEVPVTVEQAVEEGAPAVYTGGPLRPS